MKGSHRNGRRLYPVVFLASSGTLLLELTLTRIFDVVLVSNLSYLMVSSAILGFGLGGMTLLLWPMPRLGTETLVARAGAAFATTVLLLIPALQFSRANIAMLPMYPLNQSFHFILLYALVQAPFFASGILIAAIVTRRAPDIHRLYFWDLAGAGVGCLGIFILPPVIGAGGVLFLIAAIGLFAVALVVQSGQLRAAVALTSVVLLAFAVSAGPQVWFKSMAGKRDANLRDPLHPSEFSRWDPVSKIDVLPLSIPFQKRIAYDGGSQSSLMHQFDGNYSALQKHYFDTASARSRYQSGKYVALAHWLKRREAPRTLVIGSAGGQETLAALVWGASHVDAVEMVCTVVDLVRGQYAGYVGHIFSDRRVSATCDEGRSFLQHSNRRYDIIQMHSNHTVSGLANGSGGAQPVYLQTVEAYKDYLSHLTPDGILQINYFAYPRMITTAAEAWAELFPREDFRQHLIITSGYGVMPTFLIKRSAWTAAEIDEVRQFLGPRFADTRTYDVIYAPGTPEARNVPAQFFRVPLSPSFVSALPYDITPPTDDRPFFRELRKGFIRLPENDTTGLIPRSTAEFLNASLRGRVPMERVHLYILGGISALASAVFVFLPLLWLRRRVQRPETAPTLIYFGCLGAGFIIVELALVYKFMLLIGFPIYTLATVLFTLLLSAAVGSYLSGPILRAYGRRAILVVAGFAVTIVALMVLFPGLRELTLGLGQLPRIALVAAFLLPVGLPLGTAFPIGISVLHEKAPELIPWAWGVNGFMTVVGSLLAVIFSITYGFDVTLGLGVVLYAVAMAAFGVLTRERR